MVETKSQRSTVAPEARGTLGLPQATALIMGSIIGVGIFNLPYSLAGVRPDQPGGDGCWPRSAPSPWRFMFAVLSRRLPADGGPYAYARAAFGNGVGFSQRVVYWITAWAATPRSCGLGVLRRGVRQQGRQHVLVDRHRAGRPVDPGRRSTSAGSRTWARSSCGPRVAQVHPARLHGDRRAVLHQHRQLHALEHQRRVATCRRSAARWRSACSATSAWRRRPWRPPRCATPSATCRKSTDLRHARQRRRLPAVPDRGVRHRPGTDAGQGQPTRRRTRPPRTRSSAAPGPATLMAARRRHLRLRRPQRLDDDLRRDAAGRRQGRAVPAALRRGCPRAGSRRSASSPPPSLASVVDACQLPRRAAVPRCSPRWCS